MARLHVLPSELHTSSASGIASFAARWLAYARPCQRFATPSRVVDA